MFQMVPIVEGHTNWMLPVELRQTQKQRALVNGKPKVGGGAVKAVKGKEGCISLLSTQSPPIRLSAMLLTCILASAIRQEK